MKKSEEIAKQRRSRSAVLKKRFIVWSLRILFDSAKLLVTGKNTNIILFSYTIWFRKFQYQ